MELLDSLIRGLLSRSFWRFMIRGVPLLMVIVLIGVPLAFAVTHGLRPAFWPREVPSPSTWWVALLEGRVGFHLGTFLRMVLGEHSGLQHGGRIEGVMLFVLWLGTTFWLMPRNAKDRRDPAAQFGDARWMNRAERRRLDRGLELGLDPDTDRPVRVAIEGNALTIAPPRTGKTTGLIVPNLLAPDEMGWQGAAVILDPKGDVYDAVRRRREELGRPVVCIDLREKGRGHDRWNPLAGMQGSEVLHLQRAARALLPKETATAGYFRIRGVDIITGAAIALIEGGEDVSPSGLGKLISDREALATALDGIESRATERLKETLKMEDRTLDPLFSTVEQAFQWLDDPRLVALTSDMTFDMAQVARGQADLFLIVPTENAETLAPLVRWIISDLFKAVRTRRREGDERVVAFIDEAPVLGAFPELETALGELPGYGMSLWTFWQNRGQIARNFGRDGRRHISGHGRGRDVLKRSCRSGRGGEALVGCPRTSHRVHSGAEPSERGRGRRARRGGAYAAACAFDE